ncbi:MAG: carboxypeptidase M32 [Euryarchaeota archaeon]|nr:carboxypeptidase M32 [Euryarchaeota archaeon]
MASLQDSYQKLIATAKQVTVIQSASGILLWDLETKMPARGLEQRSEQLALLDVLTHKTITDPKVGRLLDGIEGDHGFADMDALQRRNVHLMRKSYEEESGLPQKLVEELAKQAAITTDAWKRGKMAKDFSIYQPELEKMLALRKESAAILRDIKGARTEYDALLDIYEPGMTVDRISELFATMRDGLRDVMDKIGSSDRRPDLGIMSRHVPTAVQRRISEAAMDLIDYQVRGRTAYGRLDETEHPFTIGYYDDVRITTHYYENRFTSSLFSILHEGGHALYEEALPREWKYQPIGGPCSYGVHESQSRFMENMIGRSPEFLAYMLPRLNEITNGMFKDVNKDDFILAVNAVEPSKIRVEADEVTYGLHIIIRFELERDIMSERLSVDELPQAWNDKYREYLGVEIENDAEGVMQDTHWSSGSLGYFPSYALGNLYGGMFLQKMEADVPQWREYVGNGNMAPVRAWLAENIHSRGSLYDPEELVRVVTGKALQVEPFLNYLDTKFSEIYDC